MENIECLEHESLSWIAVGQNTTLSVAYRCNTVNRHNTYTLYIHLDMMLCTRALRTLLTDINLFLAIMELNME